MALRMEAGPWTTRRRTRTARRARRCARRVPFGAAACALLVALAVTACQPAAAPGAPATVTAVPGDGTAKVTWSTPASNGSPITGYVVTPIEGTTELAARTFTSTATTQTVTGLTNGRAYAFRVAAVNAIGTGAATTSAAIVAGSPPAPAFPAAVAAPTSARVSWWQPTGLPAPVSGAIITPISGATSFVPRVFTSTANSQTVTGLVAGTRYRFRIALVNALGTGPTTLTPEVTVGVPAAPTKPTTTRTHGRVTVRWSVPATPADAAPTGYVVTPLVGGKAQAARTFDASASTRVITGLDDATAYTFTVSAVNRHGTGAASAASAAVTPSAPPSPTVGTIDLVGDSIAFEAHWARDAEFGAGFPARTDLVNESTPGVRFQDLQPDEEVRVRQVQRPSALVIALGTNNAKMDDGGWTIDDEAEFDTLLHTPADDACVVVVLPGYGPQADADRKREGDKARAAMAALAATRDDTVVVDWGAVALAHPELLQADGIHLASDGALPGRQANEAAANAFAAVLWDGVARCDLPEVPEGTVDAFTGLANPSGMAIAPDGTQYVADTFNDRVVSLAPGGTMQVVPFTGLRYPTGLALAPDGTLYVADTGNDAVRSLSPAGVQATLPLTGLDHPIGVVVRPNGDVYVTDAFNDRVVTLPAGGVQQTVAISGLDNPTGVAVDPSGTLYVADTEHDRIVARSPSGTVRVLPTLGLDGPALLSLEPDGDLLIADRGRNRAVRFGADGGQEVIASPALSLPMAVVRAADGRIHILDTGNNRVIVPDSPGDD